MTALYIGAAGGGVFVLSICGICGIGAIVCLEKKKRIQPLPSKLVQQTNQVQMAIASTSTMPVGQAMGVAVPAVPFGAKFDPNTGKPIPKFDPETGKQNWYDYERDRVTEV